MYVIRVIPVGKSILKEELSYFSKHTYPLGSFVEIPVRNRKMYGLVHKVESVTQAKAELRSSSFELKQLKDTAKTKLFLSESFTSAALTCALYHAHPLGTVLDSLIPRKILNHVKEIPASRVVRYTDDATPEKLVFQDDTERRAEHYRSLVRESFARGKSIYILVANKSDGARLEQTLQKGIEDYFVNFSRTIPEKELVDTFKKVREEKHPMLLIGTGKYLSVERHDLGTIVVERESSRSYREQRRPYMDYRVWAELYAKHVGARIIFADTMLRVETVGRMQKGELAEHVPLKRRLTLPPHIDLIDVREKLTKKNDEIKAVSETLKKAALDADQKGEKMIIISARKGLSPVTYCRDCGTMVLCPICGASMVLHTGHQENFFLCHKCGERKSADTTCEHCGSWNLHAYGIGIEKVEKELMELIPKKHLVRLDKDTAETALAARDKIRAWQEHGTILLGTERMFSFIEESHIYVNIAGISGIDALFSIPDFRIYERIFSLIATLGNHTKQTLIIDTHNPEHALFSAILRNDLMNFYREELMLRKALSYPPESVFIKISLSGQKDAVLKEIEQIKHIAPEKELVVFPALTRRKGLYTMHALLKINRTAWPEKELAQKLSLLPPRFIVHVDPESLLS